MSKIKASIITVSILVLNTEIANAQDGKIYGTVSTEDGITLNGAIVNMIYQEDSIFYAIVRTDSLGKFALPAPVDTGRYYLVFLYPRHTDVSVPIEVDERFEGKDLGNIKLPLNSVFLDEVVITARGLMKVKGDTLEYDISGLKLQPNARLEDIVDQLPGMRITRGGQLYSHGRVVERVLVDGEPFFGNDPTLVSKNIRADMVDKIQVYDGSSEREKVTGIKDDNKQRTVDIKLKEDKKRGMFGLAEIGYLDDFYNNVLMLNIFNGQEKVFGFGVLSNSGRLGVGYKNMNSSGGGLGNQFDAETGNFTGEGRPKVYSGGAGYSNIWGKHKLNTHISAKGITVDGHRDVYQVIDAEARPQSNSSRVDFNNIKHEQDFGLNYQKDGNSQLYIDLNIGHGKSIDVYSQDSRVQYITEEQTITQLNQDNNFDRNNLRTNLHVNWSTDLGKKDRRISFGIHPQLMFDRSDNLIHLMETRQNSTRVENLQIAKNRTEHDIDLNLTYSEPIFNGLLVNSFERNNYISSTKANTTTQASDFGDLFNGNFKYNYTANLLKSVYRATLNKFRTEFGTGVSFDRFDLDDRIKENTVQNDFVFFQPLANFEYRFSQSNILKLQYHKTNIAPTSYLVQPFSDYTDLLNVYSGNDGLRPQSQNRFYLDYYNFKVEKMRGINASFTYNLRHNAIGYSILTEEGRNSISPINIDKKTFDYQFRASYSTEVNTKKDYLFLVLEGIQNVSYNYINSIENRLHEIFIKFQPSYSFKERYRVRFNFAFGPTIERLTYSQNSDFNYSGIGAEGFGGIDINLPYNFRLEQRFNYTYRPQNQLINTSLNQLLWDAVLKKYLGKEKSFTAEFSVNDLLNQNLGLRRMYGNTGFTESRYTAINRYFLLTVKWDINKMGGQSK